MENPQNKWRFEWENHPCLWAIYSMAMLNNQRVHPRRPDLARRPLAPRLPAAAPPPSPTCPSNEAHNERPLMLGTCYNMLPSGNLT